MGTTRRQLRRDILRDLGDLRLLRATAVGTNVTLTDSVNLIGEVNAYAGREVLFSAGTAANIGEIRHVNGSSATSRSIGWGVSLPAATAVNDEAEMINTRGLGFRFQDVHDSINRAIRSVKDQALVQVGVDTQAYVRGNALSIPPEFRRVEGIQWQSASDPTIWHWIAKAPRANGHGWWVDESDRTIVVNGTPAWTVDGRTIKLWGLAEPAELHDDDDETEIDYDWLVFAAQSTLARARHMRMPTPENERLLFFLTQEAMRLRGRVITPVSGFSVEV